MKKIQSLLLNAKGSAIMAILVLVPTITIGGIAAYQMTTQTANISFQAAAEENAYFAAEGATERVLGIIINDTKDPLVIDGTNPSLLSVIKNAGDGTEPAVSLGTQASPQTYLLQQNRYKGLAAKYITTKVPPRSDAPANTIAIEITARLYNGTSASWGDKPLASKTTYQEFDGGAVKVRGCAANYDFFAGHDYNNNVGFKMMSLSTGAHYAGNEWTTCPGMAFFSFSNECIDQPTGNDGVHASYSFFGMSFGCQNKCGKSSKVHCNANAITFGDAIGTPGTNKINLDGTSVGSFKDSQAKMVIDRISLKARSVATLGEAVALMKTDSAVKQIIDVTLKGNWYFRDANGNGIPDIDAPYFYHDGDVTTLLPMNLGMFRMKNVYLYVNGSVTDLSFASGNMFNGSQLYIMAKGDIKSFSMTNFGLASAGLVAITGGSYTNTAMMEMSGFTNTTLLSNNNINLSTGFSMTFSKRMHLVAANDISISSGFSMGGTQGSNGGKCGCTGTADETMEFSIGRRFNG